MKHPASSLLTATAALLLATLPTPARAAVMVLHTFTGSASDGVNPYGSLTLSGSKLYGMTTAGGSSDSGGPGTGAGVLFSMNTDGSGFGLLHSFAGGTSDGTYPLGSLTLSGSKLYGMTTDGGLGDLGALFSIGTDGSGFDLLESFASTPVDGAHPAFGDLTLWPAPGF